jgi:hypothetical protein
MCSSRDQHRLCRPCRPCRCTPKLKNIGRSFRGVRIRPSKHITQKVRRRLPVSIHNGIVSTSPTGPPELCPTSLPSLTLSKLLSCRRSIPVAKRRRTVHKTPSVMHSGGEGRGGFGKFFRRYLNAWYALEPKHITSRAITVLHARASSNGKYDDANTVVYAEPPHECRANH